MALSATRRKALQDAMGLTVTLPGDLIAINRHGAEVIAVVLSPGGQYALQGIQFGQDSPDDPDGENHAVIVQGDRRGEIINYTDDEPSLRVIEESNAPFEEDEPVVQPIDLERFTNEGGKVH